MKIQLKLYRYVFVVLAVVIFASCQKDIQPGQQSDKRSLELQAKNKPVTRPYKDKFVTYYQFVPDFANGWTPPNPGPAWYPGGGEGNATHMGKAWTYFNQYASFGPNGFGSVAAPVNMFFVSQLNAVGLVIPDNVSSIAFDKKGNSVWFRLVNSTTVPVSASRINFSGDVDIVGGTGKFHGATGQVKLSGYFNPTNQQDAGVSNVGTITY